jgi:organic radical activating enzyme
MYIWKIDEKYLQLKDAYFSWITPKEVPIEALPWITEYGIYWTHLKNERFRLGPLNVKAQNLELYLGSKCTMNCTFCMTKAFYEYYGTDPEIDNFDIKAIEHYMDILMPENIFFSGGEPPDYMDRVEALLELLKTKYNSQIRIILDTSGEHTEQIKRLKTIYPNMTISVTVELPRKGVDKNYRGQDFYTLIDNLERLVKDLALTHKDFNVKPYFSPDFDPSYYEYLHTKGFKHEETDVYHAMRPGVYFPRYSNLDIKNAIELARKFDSVKSGDKNPVYAVLSDSGNPCIKNMSQFRQLEKGYVCRHDFDGTYTEGSLDNYYENKVGIYKLGLQHGEGYCCVALKHPEQSETATAMIRFMAADRVLTHFKEQPDIELFISNLNKDYAQRDKVLAKLDVSDTNAVNTGDVICHLTDDYWNLSPLDIMRYKSFLGLLDTPGLYFDDFSNINKYEDEQILVLSRKMGYYGFVAIGKKKDMIRGLSKTYWYNKILGECVHEGLSATASN